MLSSLLALSLKADLQPVEKTTHSHVALGIFVPLIWILCLFLVGYLLIHHAED